MIQTIFPIGSSNKGIGLARHLGALQKHYIIEASESSYYIWTVILIKITLSRRSIKYLVCACLTQNFNSISLLGHCLIREFRWSVEAHNDFFLKISRLIFGLPYGPIFKSNSNPRHHPITSTSSRYHLALHVPALILKHLLLPLSVPNSNGNPDPSMYLDLTQFIYPH